MNKFIFSLVLISTTINIAIAQTKNNVNVDIENEKKAFVDLVNTKENKQLIYSLLRNTKRSVISSKGLTPKIKQNTVKEINEAEKAIKKGLTKQNIDKLTNSSLDDLGVNINDPITVDFRKSK